MAEPGYEAGATPDRRDGQITRLKAENAALRQRLTRHNSEIQTLEAFKTQAVSQLAAQHLEIERLRSALANNGNVYPLLTLGRPAS